MAVRDNATILKPKLEHIVIACCTYKRPLLLKQSINSLLCLALPDDIKIEILIIDNDQKQSAKNIVAKYQECSVVKIHYIVEDRLGLACVRNAALKKALELGASHLLFIDDDEIATKNWLINHIDFYNRYQDISISSGPTYKKFEKEYPHYITNNNLFKRTSTKKLGQYRKCCATGNVLFPLSVVTENGIYFSEEFNFLGGEDGDFFVRASNAGFNIGWNSSAINYEIIGDERAKLEWLFNRSYKDGYSGSVVKFKDKTNTAKRFIYIIEKALLLPLNLILSITSILFGFTTFINSVCLTIKNIGKLNGAIRLKPIIYYQKREVQNG